jgi:hypothetical protein
VTNYWKPENELGRGFTAGPRANVDFKKFSNLESKAPEKPEVERKRRSVANGPGTWGVGVISKGSGGSRT